MWESVRFIIILTDVGVVLGTLRTMTKTFQIIEDLKDFDKKDFENLWWTLISQVEEDLAEDYKNTLLIQHCKGDEMDLQRRRKLQKNLKEEYLTMLV